MCGKYGVPVRDFSASMADGKAVCLLIHHYQPQLIPLDKIHLSTKERRRTSTSPLLGRTRLGFGKPRKGSVESALAAERANFALAKATVVTLGCVPFMGTSVAAAK